MFKQYRKINQGEFFVIGGDCSQGGNDYNACQFISKTKLDVPLVYHSHGVAAQMTTDIFPMLEKLHSVTGVQPVVAFEQNNGGISEMDRLSVLNRLGKFKLYVMPRIGNVDGADDTNKYGYSTNTATRPILLGDLKRAIDKKTFRIYDEQTVSEMFSFIINRSGKPEAETGMHDDLIMSLAIAWQLYQSEQAPDMYEEALPDDTKLFNEGFY